MAEGDIARDAMSKADQVAGQNSATNDDPIIWVGSRAAYVGRDLSSQKQYQKLSQIQQKVKAWSASRSEQGEIIRQKMVKAGFISKTYSRNPESLGQAMQYPVKVYQAYAAEGGALSFDDWLDWYANSAPEKDGEGGAYRGPVTTTSVTVTDETTAEALLDKFARDMLGRGLTEKETKKYLSQFRTAEMESPQVSTTTPQGRAARTQVTETAANKEELLRQIMVENPDYQKYQIDTTIMDLLLNDIKKGQEVIGG